MFLIYYSHYTDALDFLYVCRSSQMSTMLSPPFETPPGRLRPDAGVAADATWPNGPKSLGRRRRRVTGSILFKSTGISISPDFPRIGSEKMHETPYLKVPQMLHEYANQHLP